ncbi:hypothetical protein MNV49_004580 [Pseudohyphozyma bogoriensis]|nr:hypothetical protein MNV49_004580 [Pseudohyphozyma bogoriensis]
MPGHARFTIEDEDVNSTPEVRIVEPGESVEPLELDREEQKAAEGAAGENENGKEKEKEKEEPTYPPTSSPTQSPQETTDDAAPPASKRRKMSDYLPSALGWTKPHLTPKGWRPVMRSAISAWCGLLLVLIPQTERMLGQASFLVLIVATIHPCSTPIASALEQALFEIFFVAAAWGWSCLGLLCAHAARRQYRWTEAEWTANAAAPYTNSGLSATQITDAIQLDLFHGEWLEARSSAVCCIFLGVGGGFLLWLRGHWGPGPALFGIIFGIIMLAICFTVGAVFPYPYYGIGLIFFLPFICQQAIGLACTFLIFPETLAHQFSDRLIATLNPLHDVIHQQKLMLASNPRTPAWLEHKSIKASVGQAMGGLALLGASEKNLTREISYARISGKDLTRILNGMRLLVSRSTGFVSFYEIVEKHLHRDFSDSKGGKTADDLVVHVDRDRSRPSSLHRDASPSNSRPPKKRARSQHRGHGKSGSHISLPSLLHEVLHPNIDIRPVGLTESQRYMDLEDLLHNPNDEEHIEEIIHLLSTTSSDLIDLLTHAVTHLIEMIHRLKSSESTWAAVFHEDVAAYEKRTKVTKDILERLEKEMEAYRHVKRLDVIRPFASLFDPTAPIDRETFRSPSHRGLFWALSFQFSLMGWGLAVVEVYKETMAVEKKRRRPRFWYPGWAKLQWGSEGGDFEDERPHQIAGFTEEIPGFKRKTFTAPRHPDYVPPTSTLQLVGIKFYNWSHFLSRPDVLFGVKAAILISLVALPAYFRSSTYFYYKQRGLWVCIMAALTSTAYVGDTTFGFYMRVIGTFSGAVIGMVVWYIGAGHGTGNPYGMAAICAVVFPLLMFHRVHFTPVIAGILPAVTAMLVIGYSWQDANQPAGSSVGYGFDVAWRRMVCVMIGITVAYIGALLPPKATQKETIRKTYGRVIAEMGGILCQVVSFANCKEDGAKAPKQIIKNIAALRLKVSKTTAAKGMVRFEMSLRGQWPEQYYASLQSLQMEILDLLGQLLGVTASLNKQWTKALLHRAQLTDERFLGEVLTTFQLISHALSAPDGAPLPMLYTPLLETFLRPVEVAKSGHMYGYDVTLGETIEGIPAHVDLETICSIEYLRFSCGISQCYAIINRLDRLMFVAKSLVGESYIVYGMPHDEHRVHQNGHDESRDHLLRQTWEGDASARNRLLFPCPRTTMTEKADNHEIQTTTDRVDDQKVKHKWLGYLWDTANATPEERRLLFKVDAVLLTVFCLGYLGKALIQSDANNAYLSGMKEDLSLYGNQLVHSTTFFNVGYILGQLPFTLLLTRLPTHYCIPAIELAVGIATLGNYAVKNSGQLYATRFLAGFFEGGYFPGVMYILSSWYTPVELGKRSGIFYASGNLGGMFSGIFQSAAYTNLDGVGGLAGWRWLFIIDAIYMFGVALLGLLILPDIPALAKPNFFLSKAEIELANRRMARVERAPPTPWTKAKAKRIILTWQMVVFPVMYALYNSGTPQQAMGYWLKSFNTTPAPVPGRTYTVSQINLLPIPYLAIAAFSCVVFTSISDGPLKGRRWPIVLLCMGGNFAVSLALYVMPLYKNIAGRFVAYYFNYINVAAAMTIYAWAAEATAFDNELRAIVSATSNMLAFIINAITPNFVWKTTSFPAAKTGYIFSMSFSVVEFFVVPLALYLQHRQRRIFSHRADEEQSSDKSDKSSISNDEEQEPTHVLTPAPLTSLNKAPDTLTV